MKKTFIPILCSVLGIVAVLAVLQSLSFYADRLINHSVSPWWKIIFFSDPDTARYAISTTSSALAAVLGITITLVLIAVQLTATHYTPRVIDLFTRDRLNIFMFCLFVASIVFNFWSVFLIRVVDVGEHFMPHLSLLISIILATVCFALLIPYFFYLFHSLKPDSIIEKIKQEALGSFRGIQKSKQLPQARERVISRIHQIGDMAKSAVIQMDVNVAQTSIQALQEMVLDYIVLKATFPEKWFTDIAFMEYTASTVERIRVQKTWMEMKVSLQLNIIFNLALNQSKDIANAVLISNRLIGERASELDDDHVTHLIIKSFNTMMKESIQHKDKFTTYNALYQYRLLAQKLLDRPDDLYLVEKITSYFKYYGEMAEAMQVPFILDTAAYDLNCLNQSAWLNQVDQKEKILKAFLAFPAQRGVLKMMTILGSFYLWKGDTALVDMVMDTLARQDAGVIASVCDDLLASHDPEFWELTDRGINFDYVEPEQRECVRKIRETLCRTP